MDLVSTLSGYEYWIYRSVDNGATWLFLTALPAVPNQTLLSYHDLSITPGSGITGLYRVTVKRRIGQTSFESLGALKSGRVARSPIFSTSRTTRFFCDSATDSIALPSPYRTITSVVTGAGVAVPYTAGPPSTLTFDSTQPPGTTIVVTWTPEPGVLIAFNTVSAWYLQQNGTQLPGLTEAENFSEVTALGSPMADSAVLTTRALIHQGLSDSGETLDFDPSGADWVMENGENMAEADLSRLGFGDKRILKVTLLDPDDENYVPLTTDYDVEISWAGVSVGTFSMDPSHPYATLSGKEQRHYWLRKLYSQMAYNLSRLGVTAIARDLTLEDGESDEGTGFFYVEATVSGGAGHSIDLALGGSEEVFVLTTTEVGNYRSGTTPDTDLSAFGEWAANSNTHDGHNHLHIAWDVTGVDEDDILATLLICHTLGISQLIGASGFGGNGTLVPLRGGGFGQNLVFEVRLVFLDGSIASTTFQKTSRPFRAPTINTCLLDQPFQVSSFRAPQSGGLALVDSWKMEIWGFLNRGLLSSMIPPPTILRVTLYTGIDESIVLSDVTIEDSGYVQADWDWDDSLLGYRVDLVNAYGEITEVLNESYGGDLSKKPPLVRLSGGRGVTTDIVYPAALNALTKIGGNRSPFSPGGFLGTRNRGASAPSAVSSIAVLSDTPCVLATKGITSLPDYDWVEVDPMEARFIPLGLDDNQVLEVSNGVVSANLRAGNLGQTLDISGGYSKGFVSWAPKGGNVGVLSELRRSVGYLYREDSLCRNVCTPLSLFGAPKRQDALLVSLPIDAPIVKAVTATMPTGVGIRIQTDSHPINIFAEDSRLIRRLISELVWSIDPFHVANGSTILVVNNNQRASGWVQIKVGETVVASGSIQGTDTYLQTKQAASPGRLSLSASTPKLLKSISWFGPVHRIGEPEVQFQLDGEPYDGVTGTEEYQSIDSDQLIKMDEFPSGVLTALVRLRYRHIDMPAGLILSTPSGSVEVSRSERGVIVWSKDDEVVEYTTRAVSLTLLSSL